MPDCIDPNLAAPRLTGKRRRLRAACLALLAAVLGAIAPAAWAVDEADLLPVDEAFALSARAAAPDRIEVRWAIAEGYYLYRHRIVVAADGVLTPGHCDCRRARHTGTSSSARSRPIAPHWRPPCPGGPPPPRRHADGQVPGLRRCRRVLPAADPHADRVAARRRAPAVAGCCRPAQPGGLPWSHPATRCWAARRPASMPCRCRRSRRSASRRSPATATRLLLRFTPAPGYYLYRDKTSPADRRRDRAPRGHPRWHATMAGRHAPSATNTSAPPRCSSTASTCRCRCSAPAPAAGRSALVAGVPGLPVRRHLLSADDAYGVAGAAGGNGQHG